MSKQSKHGSDINILFVDDSDELGVSKRFQLLQH